MKHSTRPFHASHAAAHSAAEPSDPINHHQAPPTAAKTVLSLTTFWSHITSIFYTQPAIPHAAREITERTAGAQLVNGWAKAGQLLSICTSASAQAALCRAAASAAPAPSARATCASPSSDQPLLGCCARSCRAAATARQQQHMKQRHARASLKLCCLKAVCDHSVGDAGCLPLICHRNASRLVMTQSHPGFACHKQQAQANRQLPAIQQPGLQHTSLYTLAASSSCPACSSSQPRHCRKGWCSLQQQQQRGRRAPGFM